MELQPAPEPRRVRQRREARRAILHATEALLVESGYERFSMRRLADRCGYTTPTIYRYFNDKQGVIHALLEEVFSGLLERLRKVHQGADASRNLRRLVREFVAFGLAHPTHYQLLMMPRAEREAAPPSSAVEVVQLLREPMAELAGAKRLIPSDREAAGQAIWALMHGLISLTSGLPDYPWSERVLDVALDMMTGGLVRPDAEPKRAAR